MIRPSPSIVATMLAFYDRMLAGDPEGKNAELVSDHPGTVFIGSAGEWVTDQEVLRGAFQIPGEGIVAGPDPAGYEDGDLGFFVDQPVWRFADGSTMDTRFTAVLHRGGGEGGAAHAHEGGREHAHGWRIVHAHLSVGVPDDEVVELQRRWATEAVLPGAEDAPAGG